MHWIYKNICHTYRCSCNIQKTYIYLIICILQSPQIYWPNQRPLTLLRQRTESPKRHSSVYVRSYFNQFDICSVLVHIHITMEGELFKISLVSVVNERLVVKFPLKHQDKIRVLFKKSFESVCFWYWPSSCVTLFSVIGQERTLTFWCPWRTPTSARWWWPWWPLPPPLRTWNEPWRNPYF